MSGTAGTQGECRAEKETEEPQETPDNEDWLAEFER